MKKNTKQKKNINIRQTIAFILMLFYPFNDSLSSKILFGSLNSYIFLFAGLLLLIPDIKRRIDRKAIAFLGLMVAVFLFLFLGNKIIGLDSHIINKQLIILLYVALIPLSRFISIDKKSVTIAVIAYFTEHIIGTALPVLMPNIYETKVLKFICEGDSGCVARSNFLHGRNAGLTSHYSTNGCYMAIFSIYFMGIYSRVKDKKYFALFLISIAALLIIGKRAHLIFTILSVVIGYIISSGKSIKDIIKSNVKLVMFGCIAVVAFLGASVVLPQLNTTFDRIAEYSGSNEDMLNGRRPLYELAVEKWGNSPILGNGWGSYIEASHIRFGDSYSTDYIHAHNDYLEVLCDRGVVGLLVYVIILAALLKRSCVIARKDKIMKFSLMYVLFFVLYGFSGTPLSLISTIAFLAVSTNELFMESKE